MSRSPKSITVAVAALSALMLVGCSSGSGDDATSSGSTDGSGESNASGETIEVAIVPKVIHPWYDGVREGFEAQSEVLAGEGISISQEWLSPQAAEVPEWTQKIEAAIQSDPDVLAISCLDPAAGVPLIKEATDAGITVLTYDTQCNESEAVAFIGHADATQDGYDLGVKLAEELGGQGQVAILAGSPGSLNHEQRVTGFTQAIGEYPDMEIVATEYDNDSLKTAINLTQNIISANPDVVGIFGANASAPVGAGQAVKEANRAGQTLVVGVDDLPEAVELLKEGVILALSVQNVPDIGAGIADSAVAIMNGEEVEPLQETGSFLVDQSNVDSY